MFLREAEVLEPLQIPCEKKLDLCQEWPVQGLYYAGGWTKWLLEIPLWASGVNYH